MTEKELRKLKRHELLELMLALRSELDEALAENARLTEKLETLEKTQIQTAVETAVETTIEKVLGKIEQAVQRAWGTPPQGAGALEIEKEKPASK